VSFVAGDEVANVGIGWNRRCGFAVHTFGGKACRGTANSSAAYRATDLGPQFTDVLTIKIDESISAKSKVSFCYSSWNNHSVGGDGTPIPLTAARNAGGPAPRFGSPMIGRLRRYFRCRSGSLGMVPRREGFEARQTCEWLERRIIPAVNGMILFRGWELIVPSGAGSARLPRPDREGLVCAR